MILRDGYIAAIPLGGADPQPLGRGRKPPGTSKIQVREGGRYLARRSREPFDPKGAAFVQVTAVKRVSSAGRWEFVERASGVRRELHASQIFPCHGAGDCDGA